MRKPRPQGPGREAHNLARGIHRDRSIISRDLPAGYGLTTSVLEPSRGGAVNGSLGTAAGKSHLPKPIAYSARSTPARQMRPTVPRNRPVLTGP
jgi:hypothetical protein